MKPSCREWRAVLIAAVGAGALSGCYYDPYLGYYHWGPPYPWGYGAYGYPYGYQPAAPPAAAGTAPGSAGYGAPSQTLYGTAPPSPYSAAPPAAGTAPGPAGYGAPPQTPYGTAPPSPYSGTPPAAYGPEPLTPYGAAPPANESVQRTPLPPPPAQ